MRWVIMMTKKYLLYLKTHHNLHSQTPASCDPESTTLSLYSCEICMHSVHTRNIYICECVKVPLSFSLSLLYALCFSSTGDPCFSILRCHQWRCSCRGATVLWRRYVSSSAAFTHWIHSLLSAARRDSIG